MPHCPRRRSAQLVAVSATAALLAVAVTPAAASAATAPSAPANATPRHQPRYRQLLGTVTTGTYLEASVPTAGTYAVEYDITATAAFYDTYLDGTELGYVGGATGTYLTRSIRLTPGGHLVQVVGPEGSGTANVYLVSVKGPHHSATRPLP